MNIEEVLKKYPESGIYDGINVDGEKVIIFRQKGNGCIIKTLQSNGWWRCAEYDEDAEFQSEFYEKGVE